MHQNLRATQNFAGVFSHQHVVAADVGFAFDAVQYQVVELAGTACISFCAVGNTAPPSPTMPPCRICRAVRRAIVRRKFGVLQSVQRPIFAVTFDNDAGRVLAESPRHRPGFDSDDLAGRRGVYRSAQAAVGLGKQLPFAYLLADAYYRLRRIANVLGDGQDEHIWQRHMLNGSRSRRGLVALQTQAAMQFAEVVSRGAHATSCRLMQSTGQGAIQSSQPVHSAVITECIR